jgi:hypothetical protein
LTNSDAVRRRPANFHDFAAEFVAEDARVFKKRLPPGECVQVGPAHANAPNSHERFALAQLG